MSFSLNAYYKEIDLVYDQYQAAVDVANEKARPTKENGGVTADGAWDIDVILRLVSVRDGEIADALTRLNRGLADARWRHFC